VAVRTQVEMLRGLFRDIRHLVLAGVAAVSTFDPTLALRVGALIAALMALPDVRSYRPTAPDKWAFAFAALTYLSLAWTISPHLTSAVGKDQVAVAVIFVAVRISVRSRRALGIIGMGYLTGCGITLWLLLQENSLTREQLDFTTGIRYGLTGLNPNYVAYAMAGGVAVAVLVSQFMRKSTPLLLAPIVIIFVGISLAGTRGALIAFTATVVWCIVPSQLRRAGLVVVYGLVVGVASGILFGFTDDLIRSNIEGNVTRETGNLNGRLLLWPIARDAFDRHLWIGSGGGTFPALNPRGIFAHNVLLDVGAGLGLVGLIVFIALIWTTLISGTRGGDQRRRALLVGVVLCAVSPPMLSGYWYQSPAAWVIIALFSRMALVTMEGHGDPDSEFGTDGDKMVGLPAATRATPECGLPLKQAESGAARPEARHELSDSSSLGGDTTRG